MKTARLTVLMSPDEKAAVMARARALSLPTAELVRRAVRSYHPDEGSTDDEETLVRLADALATTVARTEARVDAAIAEMDRMRTVLAESDRRRGREVAQSDPGS